MASQDFDVIVVGSGISGGWAAKELCEHGFKVLLLERGQGVRHSLDYDGEGLPPWDLAYRTDAINRDELDRDYEVQQKNRTLRASTKQFFVKDSEHQYTQVRPFSWIRGYQLGGRSLTWGRQCYRLSDLDFSANKRDGHGTDWPIRYKDVERWYSHVERFIGVSGTSEGISHLPDGEFQPGMELNCVEAAIKRRLEARYDNRKLIIGRCAHLTDPTPEQTALGRSKCMYRNECARGCSFGAYFSSQSATLPAAERTGNLTIKTNKIVHEIECDSAQRKATGVRVTDSETRVSEVYDANAIFLCASTIASTQILLNSRSAAHPNGLANSSGLLGHFLMDHVSKVGAIGTVDGFDNVNVYGRRPTGFYIPRFRNLGVGSDGFLRGYAYQGSAYRETWHSAVDAESVGEELKNDIRRGGDWKVVLIGFGEMLPQKANAISLDRSKTDKWGIPLVRVKCEFGINEQHMAEGIQADAAEMLNACGLTKVVAFNGQSIPGETVHEMGTARMGRNPETSVLNGFNQSHDVPNLFVTDGSAMASSACQNPSLTYMALTARAADYYASNVRDGSL